MQPISHALVKYCQCIGWRWHRTTTYLHPVHYICCITIRINQASVAEAKAEADRARREFESRRRAEQQGIQGRLGKELAELQKELAVAKAKAATDISRAQVIERMPVPKLPSYVG